MMILIDGYNLLHAIGIAERTVGPGTLDRARKALLGFLTKFLDASERASTTIVFDSQDAPPGLPREYHHDGMTVRYATGYESADELLEELIQTAPTPRQTTVVSSDHRVQRAATRRRAKAVDSEVWYEAVRAPRATSTTPSPPTPHKPHHTLSDAEVDHWLAEFGDIVIDELIPNTETLSESEVPQLIDNPFPPGYGEDLLEE